MKIKIKIKNSAMKEKSKNHAPIQGETVGDWKQFYGKCF